ncbi:MAG: VOC family protein [Chloroflexota bacterium]
MPNQQTNITEVVPMLVVPDLEATTRYYEEKLGFEIEFVLDDDSMRYAVVHRNGFFIHFIGGHVESEPGAKGGVNISVTNADELYAEFQSKGAFSKSFPTSYTAMREHPPEDKAYGTRDFIMIDPNGYVLAFGHPLD